MAVVHRISCALSLLLCGLFAAGADAKSIKLNWVHGKPFGTVNACVGDTITFTWARGVQHDLLETKTRTCSKAGAKTLFPMALSGSKTVIIAKAGTRHFMCSVGLHCPLGQIVSVSAKVCSG